MAHHAPGLVLLALFLLSSTAWAYPSKYATKVGNDCLRHPENTTELSDMGAAHKVRNLTSAISFLVNTTDGCLVPQDKLCAGAEYNVTVKFQAAGGHYLLTSTFGEFNAPDICDVSSEDCKNRICKWEDAKKTVYHNITMPANASGDNVFRVSWSDYSILDGSRITYTFGPADSCVKACPAGPPPQASPSPSPPQQGLTVGAGKTKLTLGSTSTSRTSITVTLNRSPANGKVTFFVSPPGLLQCASNSATLANGKATVVCTGLKAGKARVRVTLSGSSPPLRAWSPWITIVSGTP